MFAPKTNPSQASRLSKYVTISQLPFLYCTRTITTGYRYPSLEERRYEEHDRQHQNGPQKQWRRREPTSTQRERPQSVAQAPFEGRRYGGDNRQHQDEQRRQWRMRGPSPTRRERPQTAPQAPRIPSIPFERQPRQQDPYEELELEGSTITPNERKAFESLFKIVPKQATVESEDGRRPSNLPLSPSSQDMKKRSSGADRGLESRRQAALPKPSHIVVQKTSNMVRDVRPRPVPEFSPALKQLRDSIRATNQAAPLEDPNANTPEQSSDSFEPVMSMAASKELQGVSKAMDAAQTDVEVWEILHNRVLRRLEGFRDDESHEGKGAGAALDRSGPAKRTSQADLKMLSQTLPEHLTRTFQRVTADFSASSLPLSIIPSLEAYGLSSVKLGISTKLCNLHMRLLYERYTDLKAITEMLQDMRRREDELDGETLELLDDILIFAAEARDGHHGAAVKVLWEMDRIQSSLVRIAESRKTLIRQLEDRALQLARKQERTAI